MATLIKTSTNSHLTVALAITSGEEDTMDGKSIYFV